ncbi:hypothetical protein IFM89_026582 [Coptis chinensis]|uniref:RING-type domain-containing protein n=1 Tax=Coptis chinensis TaxID=261450 RepID=A0A835IQT4_9MAGN|nr:hypothetical protein IFM89_026582 [Coptis chinensis]
MTSASELFHGRRSRLGRNDDTELGFGSSIFDRNIPTPLINHHHNRRRSRHNQRRDIEDCNRSSSSSSHSRHREHEPVRLDHGASQFNTGSSSSRGTSSSRANRMQFTRTDQLPGDVLLARERLVERLRGVSLSANRQSSRLTSGVPWNEFLYNDDFRLIDTGGWEIETSADWLGDDPISDSSTLIHTFSSLPDFSTKRPPGLNQEEVNCLQREIFNVEYKDDVPVLEAVLECSICLDRLHEGDDLICLPCKHKFHSGCLYPWVRTCGDCPNCRAGVVIVNHGTQK